MSSEAGLQLNRAKQLKTSRDCRFTKLVSWENFTTFFQTLDFHYHIYFHLRQIRIVKINIRWTQLQSHFNSWMIRKKIFFNIHWWEKHKSLFIERHDDDDDANKTDVQIQIDRVGMLLLSFYPVFVHSGLSFLLCNLWSDSWKTNSPNFKVDLKPRQIQSMLNFCE